MSYMGILKHRDHDVFVSYAHIDDIPDHEGEKGWVERFESQLRVRLLKRFGDEVEVWRDNRKLGRAEKFDDVIEKAIKSSGIMVALITNRYLKSDYCTLEINSFDEKVRGESDTSDHPRIFPVLLYNIRPEHWPAPCRGRSGFMFHDAREATEHGEPLNPGSDEFDKMLRQLVEELHSALTGLRKVEEGGSGEAAESPESARHPDEVSVHGSSREPESTTTPKADFNVFLATPADDLRPTWAQIAAGLEREGIGVLEPIPPPYEEGPHAEKALAAVEKADLCVHLLGAFPGAPLGMDDPSRTFPLEQARLALERSRSQLVLQPEDIDPLDIADPAYAEFVESLSERKRDGDRFELAQVGRHQMLDVILDKRAKIEEAKRQLEASEAGLHSAFIDLHTDDVRHASDLVGFLAQKRIAPVMVPSSDLSPTAGMSLFEDNLKRAQLFIIVFGAVGRKWVENRLQEAFKLILSHNLDTHIGVYVAPPNKESDALRFPRNFDVALNMDRFDPSTLRPLLEKAAG